MSNYNDGYPVYLDWTHPKMRQIAKEKLNRYLKDLPEFLEWLKKNHLEVNYEALTPNERVKYYACFRTERFIEEIGVRRRSCVRNENSV